MSFGSSPSLNLMPAVISRKSCFQLHIVTFLLSLLFRFLICLLFNQMPIRLWNWLKSNIESSQATGATC